VHFFLENFDKRSRVRIQNLRRDDLRCLRRSVRNLFGAKRVGLVSGKTLPIGSFWEAFRGLRGCGSQQAPALSLQVPGLAFSDAIQLEI